MRAWFYSLAKDRADFCLQENWGHLLCISQCFFWRLLSSSLSLIGLTPMFLLRSISLQELQVSRPSNFAVTIPKYSFENTLQRLTDDLSNLDKICCQVFAYQPERPWQPCVLTAALLIFYRLKSPYGNGCYQILEGGWRSWGQLILQWDTFFKYYPEHCLPNVLIKVEDEDAKPALVRQITQQWFVERGSCFCQTNWSYRTFVLFCFSSSVQSSIFIFLGSLWLRWTEVENRHFRSPIGCR